MKLLPEFGLSASGIGCSLADGWYINGFDRLRIAFLLSRSANLQSEGAPLVAGQGPVYSLRHRVTSMRGFT